MIYQLSVPYQWQEEYTKYPGGLTVFEAICDWVTKVNLMVDHLNLTQTQIDKLFTDTLPENVETVLNAWHANGQLADLINIQLFDNVNEDIEQISYNVRNFGATGDGVANDTSAFQAVAALPGAKTIVIPAGVYLVNDTVILNDDTTIVCDGEILERVTGEPLFLASGKTNIHIRHPKVTGLSAGPSFVSGQETFRFEECSNVSVNDGDFKDIAGRNAILFYHSTDVSALRNRIAGYSYAGISCLQGCKGEHIHHNIIFDSKNSADGLTYPIMLSGYDGTGVGYPKAEDIFCSHNTIDNVTPYWEGIDAHGGKNIHIHNNIVKGSYVGISVISSSLETWYVEDVFIHDNMCIAPAAGGGRDIANNGIQVTGVDGSLTNAHIHDNTVIDFGKLTISVTDLSGIKVNNVIGGSVHDNMILKSKGYGARITSKCKNLDFRNNQIITVDGVDSYAVYLDNTANDVTVEGNKVKGCVNFIRKPLSSSDPANTLVRICRNDIAPGIVNSPNGIYTLPDKAPSKPAADNCLVGQIGDVVLHQTPALGQPAGWVCIAPGDGVNVGTWADLPVLA